MKNSIALFQILLFSVFSLAAQDGCDIKLKLTGLSYDTVWFGHTYGKRAEPEFFAVKDPDGFFNLKSDAAISSGMYAIIYKRALNANYQYFSCWLADGQRKFTIFADINKLRTDNRVSGSKENELLYTYFSKYYDLTDALDDLIDAWKDVPNEVNYKAMADGEETLRAYEEEFVQKNPGTLTAALVQQTKLVTPPASTQSSSDWQANAEARHAWYRSHYFDRLDLGSGQFLKYPLWIDYTDYYFSKLSPAQPDTMRVMIEDILHRMSPDEKAYQYYFNYLMNSMGRMSKYRIDEVFVYFVRNYIEKGKANWLDENDAYRFRADAARMEPLFVGKQAPDVTLYDQQNNPVTIHDIKAPFTLMIFWLYDCSHCQKELPMIIRLTQQYRSMGLKVVSICGKTGETEAPKCWKFAEKLEMPVDWYVLADPERKTRFSALYNAYSYPRLILLDANKNIVYKQNGEVPEATLAHVFEQYIK